MLFLQQPTTGARDPGLRTAHITNVQVVANEEPRIIECAGSRTTPSVVSFQADGPVLVGHDAKRREAIVTSVPQAACCD